MAAPLLARGRVIGMMAVWRTESDAPLFTEEDLNFLVGLSQQAAIAIENARLFTEIGRQKQYFESLVEISPVAVVTMDRDEVVSGWNPAAERLFGYSAQDAIGAHDRLARDQVVRVRGRGTGDRPRGVGAGPRASADPTDARRREVRRGRGRHRSARRRRRSPGLLRDLPRRERAPGGSTERRRGERGEERVPGDDEPRDPHADERDHRHERAAARHGAERRAAGVRRRRSRRAARRCWRSSTTSWTSRRSRPARWTWRKPRSTYARASNRPSSLVGPSAAKKGIEVAYWIEPGTPEVRGRGRQPPAPDPAEPAEQRGEVHGAGRGRGDGLVRAGRLGRRSSGSR